jgi:hypothetical protein
VLNRADFSFYPEKKGKKNALDVNFYLRLFFSGMYLLDDLLDESIALRVLTARVDERSNDQKNVFIQFPRDQWVFCVLYVFVLFRQSCTCKYT